MPTYESWIVRRESWLPSIYLVMNSATADAGRALYGIAKDDMTVKQLNHLNARGVPARAMFCDLVIDIALLLFVGNTLSIIFAANVGYMTAVFFAVTGFLLLRRDRPAWSRTIRLGRAWAPVAAILGVYNLVLVVVGGLNPGDAGYGGTEEQLIGVGILLSSLVLFLYSRVVQTAIRCACARRRHARRRRPPSRPPRSSSAFPSPEPSVRPSVNQLAESEATWPPSSRSPIPPTRPPSSSRFRSPPI